MATTIKSVLIADDVETICTMLKRCFEQLRPSYQVVTATNKTEALDQLRQQCFDLAILHCQMFDKSDLDLVQSCFQSLPGMRMILITDGSSPEWDYALERIDFHGYLKMPFMLNQFLALLEKIEKGIL